jgi:hypothetical protein
LNVLLATIQISGKTSREGRAVYFFFLEVATKKLLFAQLMKNLLYLCCHSRYSPPRIRNQYVVFPGLAAGNQSIFHTRERFVAVLSTFVSSINR